MKLGSDIHFFVFAVLSFCPDDQVSILIFNDGMLPIIAQQLLWMCDGGCCLTKNDGLLEQEEFAVE